jgi:threonine 3-dehydrogenase
MQEGFDVGLEMSGNPQAFRDMLANMAHGGKIAMLGIPAKEMAIDWHTSSSHADHQGHLRPRDVRDLVQDERDARVRARPRPVITHRFHHASSSAASRS